MWTVTDSCMGSPYGEAMHNRTPGYVRANVEWWEGRQADQLELAERAVGCRRALVGHLPHAAVLGGVLPRRLGGSDVVELGCGTGYVSAWLARRGARPVAVDPTPGQLAIAASFRTAIVTTPLGVRVVADRFRWPNGRSTLP